MAVKRGMHLCGVQLKQLLLTPTTYVFLGLLFVYFYKLNEAARLLHVVTGLRLNAIGYTVGAFSSNGAALVFGLGAVAVFSGLPLVRENAVFEAVRCGRGTWVSGRILFVVFVSFAYTLIMALLCVLTSGGEVSFAPGWGKLINTLVNGYVFEGIQIDAEFRLSYTTMYTPSAALAITLAMCWGAATLIGLTILWLSLLASRIPALLAGTVIALFDFIISEKLPYWAYHYSPVSFTRMSIVSNPDIPHYPTLEYAVPVLLAAVAVSAALCYAVTLRSKAFSGILLKEQY
ncbi:MAG TPA: hypothetical protein PKU80_10350 [Candidatus Limiplasma sp.]|nr:hypothetical protein [Candidatus Limiplasma sp.]